jgi:hypothetical protein
MAKSGYAECVLKFDSFFKAISSLSFLGILIYFTVEYAKEEHCGKLKDLSLAFIIIFWISIGFLSLALCCLLIGGIAVGASM